MARRRLLLFLLAVSARPPAAAADPRPTPTADVTPADPLPATSPPPDPAPSAPPSLPADPAALPGFPYALRTLAPDVHVLVGDRGAARPANAGAVGNLGLVVTPAGAVVVNTGGSYRAGQALIALARRLAGDRPPVVAIVTQARPEYVMGIGAFVDQGIEVVAHAATAQLVVRRCAECLRRLQHDLGEAAMQGTRIVAPTRTVTAPTALTPGGRRLELLLPGPGQTAGDLAVLDVASRVLFAGALVAERRVPELEDPGGARPWRRALQALGTVPATRLVPGYGEPGAPGPLLDGTDGYLAALDTAVQAHWDRGGDLLTAAREIALPAWRDWAQYDPLHARNVQREVLAAEARWLQAR